MVRPSISPRFSHRSLEEVAGVCCGVGYGGAVEDRRELFQQEATQSKDWSLLRVSFTEILRTSAHFTLFGRQFVSLYMLMGTMYCTL